MRLRPEMYRVFSLNGMVGAGFGNGNTFPQVYDAVGRFVFAGFTVDF